MVYSLDDAYSLDGRFSNISSLYLVHGDGIEPPAPWASTKCSTGLSYPCVFGTSERIRTPNKPWFVAKCSIQLSYGSIVLVGRCGYAPLPVKDEFYRLAAETIRFTSPCFGRAYGFRTRFSALKGRRPSPRSPMPQTLVM